MPLNAANSDSLSIFWSLFSQLKTHTEAMASTRISPKIQMKFISSKPHLHNARTHLELFTNERNGIGRNGLAMCRCFPLFFKIFHPNAQLNAPFEAKLLQNLNVAHKWHVCAHLLARFSLMLQPWLDIFDALSTVYTEDVALSIVKEYLTRSSSSSFLLLFHSEFVGTFHTAACNSFRISRGG